MIGKPKYKYNDIVGFWLTPYGESEPKLFIGHVYIIDAYGTFEQNEEPSYDIMVENFMVEKFNGVEHPCLVKHVRESECIDVSECQ